MAQFAKNIFGTSYFGKTNTFEGVYQTEVIDTDEPFDGIVDIEIKAELPSAKYYGNNKDWFFTKDKNWTITNTDMYTDIKSSAFYDLSTDILTILFDKNQSKSNAKIIIRDTQTQKVLKEELVDTSTVSEYKTEVPFQLISVEIQNTEDKRLQVSYIQSRVTVLALEIRSRQNKKDWNVYESVPIFYDVQKKLWIGHTVKLIQQQFIQGKLHLGTSDLTVSPIVDSIRISSGDTSKRTQNGYWMSSLNMNNIATEQKTTFKKVTKVEYKKDNTANSEFTLRSTSTTNTFPNREQIKDDLYWKSETAPYVFYKNTKDSVGTPWSRISLSKNATTSYVIGFEMSAKEFGLANSKIVKWLTWNDQSFFPTDKAGQSITYKIFENKNDYDKGIPPIFIVNNPDKVLVRNLSLPAKYMNKDLFVYIELNKLKDKQTPVVDFVDLIANMQYTSPIQTGSKSNELSAIDNGNGHSLLEKFNSGRYNFPNNNQTLDANKENLINSKRKITIKYSPLFSNQVDLYFTESKYSTSKNSVQFKSTESFDLEVHSKVIADEPLASTQQANPNRLVYHYGMDGGTVQFPKETIKELLTDYSPNLLKNIKYQFQLFNGWPDEKYLVINPITWEEASELTGTNLTELKNRNKNVKLYENKIPQDVTLILPNNSLNKNIQLKFESNNSSYTKKSLWNKTDNDRIVAKIPTNSNFGYKEWISEEKIYSGYINPNNIMNPYIRSQKAIYTSNEEYVYLVKTGDTYVSISKATNTNPIDLEKRNDSKVLAPNMEIMIPASFSLPYIAPEVIYENRDPFIVEIIPFSVINNEGKELDVSTITLGSDSESVLKYTYIESEPVTNTIKRGPVLNGRDALLYSNPNRILAVVDITTNYIYKPYSKGANETETGDYKLIEGYIDWSSAHALAKEPAKDSNYKVTYTYDVVDNLRITMTSDYVLKSGYNKLWKSPEIKEFDGIATPDKDFKMELPLAKEFQEYNSSLTDVEYLVEDNDLWVKTSIIKDKNKTYLFGTLNKEDPKRNWYPTINTGFYYLSNQEYYLYSSALEHNFSEEALPIVDNLSYNNNGAQLFGKRSNLVLDSSIKTMNKQKVK